MTVFNHVTNSSSISMTAATCWDGRGEWDSVDFIAISVNILLFCLFLLGTVYDLSYYQKEESRHSSREVSVYEGGVLQKTLVSFSFPRNFSNLLDKKEMSDLDLLPYTHGLRVLSMFWLLWGWFNLLAIGGIDNPAALLRDIDDSWTSMISNNAHLATDTFFLLSGLLVTYHMLDRMDRRTGSNVLFWTKFYVHKYCRLTFAHAWYMLMYTSLFYRVCIGPLWTVDAFNSYMCRDSWWTNLLYINNFYPSYIADLCLSWTWFIACLIQFFIFTPPLLVLMKRSVRVSYGVIIGLICASVITTAVISYIYGLPVTFIIGEPTGENADPDLDYIFKKPYTRCVPYLIGMMLGCDFRQKNGLSQHYARKLPKWAVVILWIVSATLCCSVIFGTYKTWGSLGAYRPSEASSVIYNSLHHLTFGLGIAWVVYACHTGHAGFVDSILSWKKWRALSRLTYIVSLSCTGAFLLYFLGLNIPFHFASESGPRMYTSGVISAYSLGFIYHIFAERPLVTLEGALFPWPINEKEFVSNGSKIETADNGAFVKDNEFSKQEFVKEKDSDSDRTDGGIVHGNVGIYEDIELF